MKIVFMFFLSLSTSSVFAGPLSINGKLCGTYSNAGLDANGVLIITGVQNCTVTATGTGATTPGTGGTGSAGTRPEGIINIDGDYVMVKNLVWGTIPTANFYTSTAQYDSISFRINTSDIGQVDNFGNLRTVRYDGASLNRQVVISKTPGDFIGAGPGCALPSNRDTSTWWRTGTYPGYGCQLAKNSTYYVNIRTHSTCRTGLINPCRFSISNANNK